MYQICSNHAKSVPYFLVLKGKIRGSWPLSFCKVCCSYASFHYWPHNPHENLLIYLLQYNSWLKSGLEMTQYWHHPPLIVELLAHQSHFQSTFNAHHLSVSIIRQSSSLNTVNWRHHLLYIHPPCKILAKNPCFLDPLPKFKWRISGHPKIWTSEIRLLNQ